MTRPVGKLPKYVQRHHGKLRVRMVIPVAARAALGGRTVLTHPLDTNNPKDAAWMAGEHITRFKKMIRDALRPGAYRLGQGGLQGAELRTRAHALRDRLNLPPGTLLPNDPHLIVGGPDRGVRYRVPPDGGLVEVAIDREVPLPPRFGPLLEQAQREVASGRMAFDIASDVTVPEEVRERWLAEAMEFANVLRALPIGLHLNEWLGEKEKEGRKPDKTLRDYRNAVEDLIAWCRAEGIPEAIAAITKRVARRYVASEAIRRPRRGSIRRSNATVNKDISSLSVFWKWLAARGEEEAESNPWEHGLSLPKGKRRDDTGEDDARAFTDDEVRRLLGGLAEYRGQHKARLADAMRIAALTGMRVEPICQLKVCDCDGGMFFVRKDKTKSGDRRYVPIHGDLAEIVRRRCEGKARDAWLFDDLPAMVTSREADQRRSDPLSKQFGYYRGVLGIGTKGNGRSPVVFHSFRHWFVTKAREAGASMDIIEIIVGNRSESFTERTYSHAGLLKQKRECIESVQLPLFGN